MERLHKKFGPEGVASVFIYVREAHPGRYYPHHTTLEQKFDNAVLMRDKYGIDRPIWVDSLDGQAHLLYGGVNTMTYIIDSNRLIVFRQYYSDAGLLSVVLPELLTHGVPADMLGVPLAQAGYQPQYNERLYQRPLDTEQFVAHLKQNGPEAVMDAVLSGLAHSSGSSSPHVYEASGKARSDLEHNTGM